MALGAFFAGLGYALIFGSPSIASLEYGAASVGQSVISTGDAFSLSFWLFWAGIVLFPVGLAILAYGIAAQKSPAAASIETSIPNL